MFYEVVNSDDWKELQEKFNQADDIFVLGHGGNLAVASHAAIDISRLSIISDSFLSFTNTAEYLLIKHVLIASTT